MSKNVNKQQVTPDSQLKANGIDPVKVIGSKANKKTVNKDNINYSIASINQLINNVSRNQSISSRMKSIF